ncbi:MAG: hypothetical protein JRG80_13175 [Deltaproteobacteria bacterium]|nr:hypothetical protein [Deltaproteobacteria bacterium]MBW2400208.1 hypothetical protein [Deltaproteobacteria bacterium]MBW2667783.1 hypothetical protein [Deltaproteobacteria bacterium]
MAGREGGDAFARPRILIAAGLLLAFLLGLAVQLPAANGDRFWVSDRQKYPLIAYNLVEHGAYYAKQDYGRRLERDEPIVPYALRAPGYPFFLAAVFAMSRHFDGVDPQCLITDRCPGATAVRRDVQRASAVVAALLVPATALLVGVAFGGWPAAVAACVLMLFSVPNNDQSRLAALFLLGHAGFGMLAYRAVGRRRFAFAAASGALLAALILTRAIFLYWLFALVVFGCVQLVMQLRTRGEVGVRTTGAITLVAILLVLPWMARNHAVGGRFAIADQRGSLLAIRAEYTEITWPELFGGFAYYLPRAPDAMRTMRRSLMRAVEPDVHGYERFNRNHWDGFYRRAKRQSGVVAARAREDPGWKSGIRGRHGRDVALDHSARDVILENWSKQIALSFVFGLRGSFVYIQQFDLTTYGSSIAAATRRLNGLAEWAVIFHVPAMIAAIAILATRRDWSRLYFFSPALFSFFIHAGTTHYLPRYSDPLTPIWIVGLVFTGGELIRAVRRARSESSPG